MIQKLFITLLALIIFDISFSQDKGKYSEFVKVALNLYEKGLYKESAEKFEAAFAENRGKANYSDRYNASCSYALAGMTDSAFYHLFRIAEGNSKFSSLEHILQDKDLISLHVDERWNNLIAIIKVNKEEKEKNYDKALVAELDSIFNSDQIPRLELRDIEKKYGRESQEMKDQWKMIAINDSINLIKIKKILDERGWLGRDKIGPKGNTTLFLIIQHADLETQVKYLPLMKEAVKNGNAFAGNLALLEDRINIRQGKKQIYGSQIWSDVETGEYYVFPLIDPENINKRRKEVGLGTIEEYVTHFKITWNIEKHKKRIAKFEAENKE